MKKKGNLIIYIVLVALVILIVGYILYRPVIEETKNYELNKVSSLLQDKRLQYDKNTKMISFAPNESEFNTGSIHFTTKIMISDETKTVGYGIAAGLKYDEKRLGFDTLTFNFDDGSDFVLKFLEDEVYVSETDTMNMEYVSITHRKKDRGNKEKNISKLMEKISDCQNVKLTFSDAGDKEQFDLTESEISYAKQTWELYNLLQKYPECLSAFRVSQ